MTTPHGDDTRHHFDVELDQLRMDTVGLGALVLENCKRLGEALIDNDLDLARTAVGSDEEVNERYAELERRTFRIMATQQPVAGDLRLLVAVTRLLYEIERTGDLVVNGAKGMLRQSGYRLSSGLHGILGRLSEHSARIFAESLDALRDLDAAAGSRLDAEDDVVDELVSEYYSALATEQQAGAGMRLETAIELSRVGRYLERIADHGVNIAEHVAFVVTGTFPHSSARDAT